MFCDAGVYSREIINMFLLSQVSGLVIRFNIGFYSDTVSVISIKLCMMVLFIELYLSKPTLSDLDCISGSQQVCHSSVKHFIMKIYVLIRFS